MSQPGSRAPPLSQAPAVFKGTDCQAPVRDPGIQGRAVGVGRDWAAAPDHVAGPGRGSPQRTREAQPRRRGMERENIGREKGLYKGFGGKKNIKKLEVKGRV